MTTAVLCAGAAASEAALVHQWAFEEPNGTPPPQVLDSVGTNHHGTFQNMDDTNRSSDVPANGSTRSLEFTGGPNFGNNDWVSLNSQIGFANTSTYSVALWYKGSDPGLNGPWGSTLVGRDNNDIYANVAIYDGKAAFIHYSAGWQQLTATSNIDDNEWHHIAVIHYADQTADIYVDGVREVTAGNAHVEASSYRIDGFMRGFNSHYTSGLLDDVRVYNDTLNEEEVAALAAVPEPASLALLAGGAVLMLRRRV
jgi:hypothetical protein